MATIVSVRQAVRRCAPGSRWIRGLDALGPLLLLAAVLAVLAAAAHGSPPPAAAPHSFGELHAE